MYYTKKIRSHIWLHRNEKIEYGGDMRSIGVNLRITMYNRSFPAAVCDVGDRCVLRGRVKCGRILFPVRLLLLLGPFDYVYGIRKGGDHSRRIPLPSSFFAAVPASPCTPSTWTTSRIALVQSLPSGFPPSRLCPMLWFWFNFPTVLFTKIMKLLQININNCSIAIAINKINNYC